MTSSLIIEQLNAFKQRDKFSPQAWDERGLQPSKTDFSLVLKLHFDNTASMMISAIRENQNNGEIKRSLKKQLYSLSKNDFDTEEREFICDLYKELADIANIDLINIITKWHYGSFLATLIKIRNAMPKSQSVLQLKQPCLNCNTELLTTVLKKDDNIPDHSWMIVRCSECSKLNLLSLAPGIKELRFGNYTCVETLDKTKFTEIQAKIRLEQISIFRK